MKQESNEFMRHELRLPELTSRGMLLGAILTVIFTDCLGQLQWLTYCIWFYSTLQIMTDSVNG